MTARQPEYLNADATSRKGRTMRAIERELAGGEWREVIALAAAIFDTNPPTRGQVEPTRAALKRLADLGRVELDHRIIDGRLVLCGRRRDAD